MQQALVIRLRPLGPWRFGPEDGGSDRLDALYRSDRLFSAVTLAMQRLGWLDEWLDATARASRPTITFSSMFPFQGETLFAIPPSTHWPPPPALVTTPSPVFLAKLRWSIARFVPLSLLDSLLAGQNILADQWLPDPESGCLLRRDRPSSIPFRTVTRSSAPVDRLRNLSHHASSLACVEFEAGSGLWTLACFANSEAESVWSDRLQAAFRLLADSGFGGRRSAGWGRSHAPEFQRGLWPTVLLPKAGRSSRTATLNGNNGSGLYWLLSLYWPAPPDQVDWTGGDYHLTVRTGRVESSSGSGESKKSLRMIAEGSVLSATVAPVGAAVDVAPNGFAHPVFRSGFALALPLPAISPEEELLAQVEQPSTEEAIESAPCAEPESEPESASAVTVEDTAAADARAKEKQAEEQRVEEEQQAMDVSSSEQPKPSDSAKESAEPDHEL